MNDFIGVARHHTAPDHREDHPRFEPDGTKNTERHDERCESEFIGEAGKWTDCRCDERWAEATRGPELLGPVGVMARGDHDRPAVDYQGERTRRGGVQYGQADPDLIENVRVWCDLVADAHRRTTGWPVKSYDELTPDMLRTLQLAMVGFRDYLRGLGWLDPDQNAKLAEATVPLQEYIIDRMYTTIGRPGSAAWLEHAVGLVVRDARAKPVLRVTQGPDSEGRGQTVDFSGDVRIAVVHHD